MSEKLGNGKKLEDEERKRKKKSSPRMVKGMSVFALLFF
jgi:hypothetical protein